MDKPEKVWWIWLFMNFSLLMLGVAYYIAIWFTDYTPSPSLIPDKTGWLMIIFFELFVALLSVLYSYFVDV